MAIHFAGSGSGEHVDLGIFDVPATDKLSIFAWAIFDSFTVGDQRIISKATSHAIVDHWFMFSGNNNQQMRVRLKTGGTTTTHYENTSTLYAGQLYHMGFVYNGSTVQFYRDGQQTGSSSKSGNMSTDNSVYVRIADNPGIHRKEFDGILEDVRMYSKALSSDEVQTMYAARGHDNIVDGLIHRWLMNEGYDGQSASGSGLVKDHLGNANGTPASSPPFKASNLQFNAGLTNC